MNMFLLLCVSSLADEIGTRNPQLEPQITSSEACNIHYVLLETPGY